MKLFNLWHFKAKQNLYTKNIYTIPKIYIPYQKILGRRHGLLAEDVFTSVGFAVTPFLFQVIVRNKLHYGLEGQMANFQLYG